MRSGELVYSSPPGSGQFSAELLQEELATVARKWYEFGQKVGLRSSQLHLVESEKGQDAEYYFKEMLSVLVEDVEVKVSWKKIVETVRELGENDLSCQLAEKYGEGEWEGEGGREEEIG